MTTLQDLRILVEVAAERTAQDAKWGEQNHPDGTGEHTCWAGKFPQDAPASTLARIARRETDDRAANGQVTWRHILLEEVAEAFAEHDAGWPGFLRSELVQVAAVSVSWLGAIGRRPPKNRRGERVYIAGPISGVPDARDRFQAAAVGLALEGYDPVNPFNVPPLEHPGQPCPPGYDPGDNATGHTSSACFVRTDLFALLGCDSVLMLEGWWHSRGAKRERDVALAVGMRVAYAGNHRDDEDGDL